MLKQLYGKSYTALCTCGIKSLDYAKRNPLAATIVVALVARGGFAVMEDVSSALQVAQPVTDAVVPTATERSHVATFVPSAEAACRAEEAFGSLAGELRRASGQWPAAAVGEDYVRDYGKIQPDVDALRSKLDDATEKMASICEASPPR